MPRIGWFRSSQRWVTAFSTAQAFNSARNLLTHCHPTRHATPVHTWSPNKSKNNETIDSIGWSNCRLGLTFDRDTEESRSSVDRERERDREKRKKKKETSTSQSEWHSTDIWSSRRPVKVISYPWAMMRLWWRQPRPIERSAVVAAAVVVVVAAAAGVVAGPEVFRSCWRPARSD